MFLLDDNIRKLEANIMTSEENKGIGISVII